MPPAIQNASSQTHSLDQMHALIISSKLRETPLGEMSKMAKIVLEASRVAMEKILVS